MQRSIISGWNGRFSVAVASVCLAAVLAPARAETVQADSVNEMVVHLRPSPLPEAETRADWHERVELSRQRALAWRAAVVGQYLARLKMTEQADSSLAVFIHDTTLQTGDIVVTRAGFHLYIGENGAPDLQDFPLISQAGASTASLSAQMLRALRRLPRGARVSDW